MAIPATLIYFVRRRKDLPFSWMFWMFGAFIIGCGMTHFLEVVTFHTPIYRFSGLVKLITAAVSLATVAGLIPLVPRALALPSPEQLELEVAERRRAEQELRTAHAELERRVEERTAALARANESLRAVIAEHQRTGEALCREQDRYRSLVLASAQIVWARSPEGPGDEDSPTWRAFTGQTYEQYRGWGWLDAIHPDDRGRIAEAWNRAVATKANYQSEYRLRTADGRYRVTVARAVPVLEPDGRIREWVGMNTDVTELREVEAALRQAHADLEQRVRDRTAELAEQTFLLQSILDGMGEGLIVTDKDCRPLLLNPAVENILGPAAGDWYVRDEEHGSDARPEDHPAPRHEAGSPCLLDILPLARACEGEPVDDTEVLVRRGEPAGDVWISCNARPLRDERGALKGGLVVFRDVTERKRSDGKFRRFMAELERSNQELQSFAFVASHDLQEPLRKIQAFGDRLGTKYREVLDEQGRDYLERMQAAAARMSGLINDLLTFSRVTTTAQPFGLVDLRAVAHTVVEDLETRLQQTGGRVEIGALPTVQADSVQIRQLFQNLISNALKFHRPGEPPVVEVRGEVLPVPSGAEGGRAGQVCRITVRDNGIGFEERYRARIFEVFQRLHGRGEFEGTGIGLAICKKIVERHGGTITAASSPRQGSVFTITLPLSQPLKEEVA